MIIIVGLILAFVLIFIFSDRDTRACRWREDRSADRAGQRHYRCVACGATTWTDTGKPPKICLRR